jgi:hypothetical protein
MMAVDLLNLELILSLIREHRPAKILAFGHPEILVDDDLIEQRFGLVGDEGGAHVLFRQLGAETFVIDRRLVAAVDQEVDLNFPLPTCHRFAYDMVLDSGTTEHVFNVGQVFVNVALALRTSGIVYHCNPLAMFNHGYWNISPVAYHDFYKANGFEILRIDQQRRGAFFPLEHEARFKMENDGKALMVCVARKIVDPGETISFPMQSKYE